MKQTICSVLGVIGSAIASFFGGWDAGLATLLIFMGLDYISGLIVAGGVQEQSQDRHRFT